MRVCWGLLVIRIGVAYSIMNFQDKRFSQDRLSSLSYMWDITRPNAPEREIKPPNPLTCLNFNPKQHDMVCGGSYNGLVSVYDLRKDRPLVVQVKNRAKVKREENEMPPLDPSCGSPLFSVPPSLV